MFNLFLIQLYQSIINAECFRLGSIKMKVAHSDKMAIEIQTSLRSSKLKTQQSNLTPLLKNQIIKAKYSKVFQLVFNPLERKQQ